jgi:rhamnogalacturonyl hydrolase YesR
MKKLFLSFILGALTLSGIAQDQLPSRAEVLKLAQKVNSWFMKKYDPADAFLGGGKVRTTNLWTRAVYHEGLCALYSIYPLEEYYEYNLKMAEGNKWSPRYGAYSLDADNYACVQTYVDLYRLEPESYKLRKSIACFDAIVNNPDNSGWWWIDAIQMGMPAFAKLGRTTGNHKYWDKMWAMYEYTRNQYDGGLWNAAEGLWWRDHDFNPPYTTPNGKNCYWSRGNGWVVAAYVRTMDELDEPAAPVKRGQVVADPYHYNDYKADFIAMCKALKGIQREDGYWNCDLGDPDNFGGPETTGTALFIYGMAWGVRKGYLDRDEFMPTIVKGWKALAKAVQPSGFVGYIQGTGKEPKDSQPITVDGKLDFEDFGIGCWLLAATEVWKLSPGEQGLGVARLAAQKK